VTNFLSLWLQNDAAKLTAVFYVLTISNALLHLAAFDKLTENTAHFIGTVNISVIKFSIQSVNYMIH